MFRLSSLTAKTAGRRCCHLLNRRAAAVAKAGKGVVVAVPGDCFTVEEVLEVVSGQLDEGADCNAHRPTPARPRIAGMFRNPL